MSWDTHVLAGESYTITVPTRAGAFFPPSLKPDTYHLIVDIDFTYGGQEHSNQAKIDLIVYPHAGGVYLGAIMGGVVGAFLRAPSFSDQSVLKLLVGSIIGLVLAVVFRRKANVQSFIAVEDFWGGFLTGIVGSYGGQDVLGRFLVPGST